MRQLAEMFRQTNDIIGISYYGLIKCKKNVIVS